MEKSNCSYSHLVSVIRKVIIERPKNVVDYLEEFSRSVRREQLKQVGKDQRSVSENDLRVPISTDILSGISVSARGRD